MSEIHALFDVIRAFPRECGRKIRGCVSTLKIAYLGDAIRVSVRGGAWQDVR